MSIVLPAGDSRVGDEGVRTVKLEFANGDAKYVNMEYVGLAVIVFDAGFKRRVMRRSGMERDILVFREIDSSWEDELT